MGTTLRDGPARTIRSTLPATRVAERYGFEPNRAGYICCPFHHEKTPSLKLYPGDRGWHCFGCGKGGDVIRFVMELFDITFPQAVVRLSADFGLGLAGNRPGSAARSKILEERRQKRQERKDLLVRQRVVSNEICCLYRAQKDLAPTQEDWEAGHINPLYLEAQRRLPQLEYEWDDLEARLEGVGLVG